MLSALHRASALRHGSARLWSSSSSSSIQRHGRQQCGPRFAVRQQSSDAVPAIHAARLRPVMTTPVKGKPYYITTPIFYVNARPHLGHLQSMVLADALARWYQWRHRGYSPPYVLGPGDAPSDKVVESFADVFDEETKAMFATGTDEHGSKVQAAASKLNKTPKALCDEVSEHFKRLADAAGIHYTRFIRTTDEDHKHTVQALWTRLVDEGLIYKGTHSGWYSVSDEAFYTKAQVRPSGDDDKEVKVSTETGNEVRWVEEVNYKFRLSLFQQPLLDWLAGNAQQIIPQTHYDDVVRELQEGLNDLSVSRPSSRLQWGIEVPGDAEQTMYVWFDALLNYVTVTGYPWSDADAQRPTGCWPPDAQIVGKDIVRFHAIFFPAFLMAMGLPLPRQLIVHGHWKVGDSKMSKSRGNVVDPFVVMDVIGRDELRHYLCRVGGNLGRDASWEDETVAEHRRKNLKGQIGGLASRVRAPTLIARLIKEGEDSVTLPAPQLQAEDETLLALLRPLSGQVDGLMARCEMHSALRIVSETVEECHRHWQNISAFMPPKSGVVEAEQAPSDMIKSPLWRGLYLSLEVLRISALLTRPVMPQKMDELLDLLEIPTEERTFKAAGGLRDRVTLRRLRSKPKHLFPAEQPLPDK